jgi:hypothetical protein
MAWCLVKHRDNFTFTYQAEERTETFVGSICHHSGTEHFPHGLLQIAKAALKSNFFSSTEVSKGWNMSLKSTSVASYMFLLFTLDPP